MSHFIIASVEVNIVNFVCYYARTTTDGAASNDKAQKKRKHDADGDGKLYRI